MLFDTDPDTGSSPTYDMNPDPRKLYGTLMTRPLVKSFFRSLSPGDVRVCVASVGSTYRSLLEVSYVKM